MNKVYLIHGWEGNPENNWFPDLKSKLEGAGFEVIAPNMPGDTTPKRIEWEATLSALIKDPDENTYLIGHSMGCRAILRYLEDLPEGKKIGGAILVAGWGTLPVWEGHTKRERNVIEDWINPPMDFEKVRNHCQKFIAIFSDNDPFVPEGNWDVYRKELKAKIIIKHQMGHFDDDAKVLELPEVYDSFITMAKK